MNTNSTERNQSVLSGLPVLQPGSEMVSELANDLSALKASAPGSAARWTTKPAVLRRVAMMLADNIPPGTTRVLATGDGGTALAAAVALTTGLTFAVHGNHGLTSGEAHAGEEVALVAILDTDLADLIAWCHRVGIIVRHGQAVFGAGHESIFIAHQNGMISENRVA